MATKVWLKEGSRELGAVTIFDAEPSFQLLEIAFPDARSIAHDYRTDRWYVDVGDQLLIASAD
jgi:hypothetical protein